MEFISTKGMTNETAPEGKVLVQYLEPFFGGWSVDFAIAHYDNPKDYNDVAGEGWCHWTTGNKINVLAYAVLPKEIETHFTKMNQKEVKEKYGDYHINMGCIGE